MLIALRRLDNTPVNATNATLADAPFVCPQCRNELILCRGGAATLHFVHKASLPCSYDFGESEAHRRAKNEIHDTLLSHPDADQVQLELPLGGVRPDVFARIRGVPVAIEVQISTLSPETIIHRTEEYTRLGIYVLWLLQWHPELNTTRYSPRGFERWLHATYFGRVYFWKQGLTVLPYHFHEHGKFVKSRRWHDERGRTRKAGGYRRISKRYKMPVCGKPLHLVHDFGKTTRRAWQSKALTVPECNLFMDTRRTFVREAPENF
jgi:competence protein CoiA